MIPADADNLGNRRRSDERPGFCVTARVPGRRPCSPASRGAGSADERQPELAGSLQALGVAKRGDGTLPIIGRHLRSLGELFGALGREVEILVER